MDGKPSLDMSHQHFALTPRETDLAITVGWPDGFLSLGSNCGVQKVNDPIKTTKPAPLYDPLIDALARQPWFIDAYNDINRAITSLEIQGFDGTLNFPGGVLHIGSVANGK